MCIRHWKFLCLSNMHVGSVPILVLQWCIFLIKRKSFTEWHFVLIKNTPVYNLIVERKSHVQFSFLCPFFFLSHLCDFIPNQKLIIRIEFFFSFLASCWRCRPCTTEHFPWKAATHCRKCSCCWLVHECIWFLKSFTLKDGRVKVCFSWIFFAIFLWITTSGNI